MNELIFSSIKLQGVLPLYFHENKNTTLQVMKALYNAGIRVVEYTNRGANALDNFKALIDRKEQEFPGLLLGIGTIKTKEDAGKYLDAGADFLISPCYSEEIKKVVFDRNATWIPGCMTPTEINNAEQKGIHFIKLFPGNLLGPSFMSAIKDLFPEMDCMPTGGVDLSEENIREWYASGVCAVGMGSKLISKKLMESEDFATIQSLTVQALGIVRSIKK
ncbi:MAG: bifunctional 4-hydroxy-2-oxoglutarate aldolase/2-dehydro-3-deoxy-phosphogluconate aldolase [Arachidicoccus sp.]|nr:bifunctional 4-hydroxy-2-oxoglutarate aldolase/2-dehydro-3-deoxy-phosphogluconate aldolase [Arachidicoccus sp.]